MTFPRASRPELMCTDSGRKMGKILLTLFHGTYLSYHSQSITIICILVSIPAHNFIFVYTCRNVCACVC